MAVQRPLTLPLQWVDQVFHRPGPQTSLVASYQPPSSTLPVHPSTEQPETGDGREGREGEGETGEGREGREGEGETGEGREGREGEGETGEGRERREGEGETGEGREGRGGREAEGSCG